MITGFALGYAKDEVIDKAFEQLEKTFTPAQALEYKEINDKYDSAGIHLLLVGIQSVIMIIADNYLFWWQDVGFWFIFLVNLPMPYIIYRAIKAKAKTTYNKMKFYTTLGPNIKGLGQDAQDALKKFI